MQIDVNSLTQGGRQPVSQCRLQYLQCVVKHGHLSGGSIHAGSCSRARTIRASNCRYRQFSEFSHKIKQFGALWHYGNQILTRIGCFWIDDIVDDCRKGPAIQCMPYYKVSMASEGRLQLGKTIKILKQRKCLDLGCTRVVTSAADYEEHQFYSSLNPSNHNIQPSGHHKN